MIISIYFLGAIIFLGGYNISQVISKDKQVNTVERIDNNKKDRGTDNWNAGSHKMLLKECGKWCRSGINEYESLTGKCSCK